MPNYVHNYLILPTTLKNQIDSFGKFSLGNLIPITNLTQMSYSTRDLLADTPPNSRSVDEQLSLINKLDIGFGDWHDQKICLHGTKWDVVDSISTQLNAFQSIIVFSTAWAPPVNALRALSLRSPQPIYLFSFDEAPNYIGVIEIVNGHITKNCYFDGADIDECKAFAPEAYSKLYGVLEKRYGKDFEEDYNEGEKEKTEFSVSRGLGYLFGGGGEVSLVGHSELFDLARGLLNFTSTRTFIVAVDPADLTSAGGISQEINTYLHASMNRKIEPPWHIAKYIPVDVLAKLAHNVYSLPQAYFSSTEKVIKIKVVTVNEDRVDKACKVTPHPYISPMKMFKMLEAGDKNIPDVIMHGRLHEVVNTDQKIELIIDGLPDHGDYINAFISLMSGPEETIFSSSTRTLTRKFLHGRVKVMTEESERMVNTFSSRHVTVVALTKDGYRLVELRSKDADEKFEELPAPTAKPAKIKEVKDKVTAIKVKFPKKEVDLAIKDNKGKPLDFVKLVKAAEDTSVRHYALIATRFTFQLAGRITNEIRNKELKDPTKYEFVSFKNNVLTLKVTHS